MVRMGIAAISVAFAWIFLAWAANAQAQTARSGAQAAQPSQPIASEASSQRRPLRRVPIYPRYEWEPDVYPRYYPGRNAVRDCTTTYVPEYRPSGTVIAPHINCYWRPG